MGVAVSSALDDLPDQPGCSNDLRIRTVILPCSAAPPRSRSVGGDGHRSRPRPSLALIGLAGIGPGNVYHERMQGEGAVS